MEAIATKDDDDGEIDNWCLSSIVIVDNRVKFSEGDFILPPASDIECRNHGKTRREKAYANKQVDEKMPSLKIVSCEKLPLP